MKEHAMRNKKSPSYLLSAGALALCLSLGTGVASAQAPRLMAPPLAADGTLSFADLVERVSPAVVSIVVERKVESPAIPSQFEDFFNFRFGTPNQPGGPFDDQPRRQQGEGSGFFIDQEGHIVTNNHVVADAESVRVRLANGDELEATIVGVDPLTDLAVLQVSANPDQAYVSFADDVNIRVGDWVVAVGNPFGLGGTVTSGIVSAIGGQNRENQYLDFIQIDAPINRGNSGGPTFDLKGRVVGVNTAIFSPNGGSVGIGFAIPSKVARETVEQLIDNGSVTRGWLGIQLQGVTTEIAAALGLKSRDGVLVAEVLDGTPAHDAGIINGDVIMGVGGQNVASPNELSRQVAALAPGEKVRLNVLRDGKTRNITVTLGKRDDAQQAAPRSSVGGEEDELSTDIGVRVSELNDSLRRQFRVPDDVEEGVVVTGVRPDSPAEQAGLRVGAVILQVDGGDVATSDELRDKIANAKKSGKDAVLMRMQLGANRQFGALTLD